MMLPYLEQTPVYNSANFTINNRGSAPGEPMNTTVSQTKVNAFICPSSPAPMGSWYNNIPWPGNSYFASTGSSIMYRGNQSSNPNGPFNVGGSAIGLRDILDGSSNTVGFGEWRIGDFNDAQNSIQDIAGTTNTGLIPGNVGGRDMISPNSNMPLGSAYLTPALQACQQCWQTNSCASHTGANPGAPYTQFSFNGRLWNQGIYCVGLGNLLVPPNSPYPYCQFENGDGDTDSAVIAGLTSFHSGGANVSMLDGSVRFLKSSISYTTLWAIGSMAQGEVVSADSY